MSHDQRVRDAIAWGRSGDPRIAEMERGGADQRWLAVVSCHGSRDGALLLRALGDASRRVRGKALVMLSQIGTDEEAAEGLAVAHAMHASKVLLSRLVTKGRLRPVDAHLDWLAVEDPSRLTDRLPLGSEAAVRRHLAGVLKRPSALFWRRLAVRHPAVAAEVLQAGWKGEVTPTTRHWTRQLLASIAEGAPEAALGLVESMLATGAVPQPEVVRVLEKRVPKALLELHLEEEGLDVMLGKQAAALPEELLVRAVEEPSVRWADVMRHLPESTARAVAAEWDLHSVKPAEFPVFAQWLSEEAVERWAPQWSLAARSDEGVIPAPQLAWLPRSVQAREAARHMNEVVALHTDPMRRVRGYARYLPFDEVLGAVDVVLKHPEAEQRSVALIELLSVPEAQRDGARVSECLALVRARKFEQDPVRGAMLSALAEWSLERWKVEHLPDLAVILRDALDAADLSDGTARHAERIVVKLFALDPDWAAEWLLTMLRERGRLYDFHLGAHLRESDVDAASDAILTIARAWTTRERLGMLYPFLFSLKEKITRIPPLADVLALALERVSWEWVAISLGELLAHRFPTRFTAVLPGLLKRWDAPWVISLASRKKVEWCSELAEVLRTEGRKRSTHQVGALRVLFDRDRAAFNEELPGCLEADPSLICVDFVRGHVHRRRTELLDRYLEGKAITGRYASGKTSWVLFFQTGFHRWTPRQNELYCTQLHGVIADDEVDSPTKMRLLGVLTQLLYTDASGLCALASDPRPPIAERTIRVLSRCDAGQGLPTLVECLGDKRARFAIYGLRRALLSLPPERASAVLRDAPLRKVTVAKEVVRLAGDVRCDDAFAYLRELAATDLHRDVRMALHRALWNHLERDETWPIFEAAVAADDWVLASRLGLVPADRLSTKSDGRLSALLAKVLERPEPEARIDLLKQAPRLAINDPQRVFLAAIRRRMGSIYADEGGAATKALLHRQTLQDLDDFEEALRGVQADPAALATVCSTMHTFPLKRDVRWLGATSRLDAVLASDIGASPVRLQHMGPVLEADERVVFLEKLGAEGALHYDALAQAERFLGLSMRTGVYELRHIRQLAESEWVGCRRAALWVLRIRVQRLGWIEEHKQVLAGLQRDSDPGVRGVALRTQLPREQP